MFDIYCAKCNKKVPKILAYKIKHTERLQIIIECHGVLTSRAIPWELMSDGWRLEQIKVFHPDPEVVIGEIVENEGPEILQVHSESYQVEEIPVNQKALLVQEAL